MKVVENIGHRVRGYRFHRKIKVFLYDFISEKKKEMLHGLVFFFLHEIIHNAM